MPTYMLVCVVSYFSALFWLYFSEVPHSFDSSITQPGLLSFRRDIQVGLYYRFWSCFSVNLIWNYSLSVESEAVATILLQMSTNYKQNTVFLI